MVDEPGAIPMFVAENRVFTNQNDHTWIVLHKTAGFTTAQDVAAFFATVADMRSAHYVVGQDGAIVQCVAEQDGAGANCCLEPGHAAYLPTGINLNVKTVSIEHVDPTADNSTPLTQAQKDASFKLVHDICLRHNIPMRSGDASGGIIGHNDLDPQSRARCPGNYPWSKLWDYLNGNTTPPQEETIVISLNDSNVNQYFFGGTDDQWNCKTGFAIAHGILAFWRSFGSSAYCGLTYLGLPITNELYLHPNTAIQLFERAIVVYDPGHTLDQPPGAGDFYLMHIDQGEGQQFVAQNIIKPLQAQIQQLQNDKNALTTQEQKLQQDYDTLAATLKQVQLAAPQAVAMSQAIQQIYTIVNQFETPK